MSKLYIDANEPDDVKAKVIKEFRERDSDIETEIKGLETGDFVFQDVVIERKRDGDLLSSIVDRRLSEQADRIAADFQHGYILVEGDPFTYEYSDLSPNSIIGTYCSLTAKRDLKIINVDSKESTAYAIYKICEYHRKDDYDATQQMLKRSSVDSEDVQVAMLSCVEGISGSKAQEIRDKVFPNGFKPAFADLVEVEDKLKQVEGVGDVLAQRIVDAFTQA